MRSIKEKVIILRQHRTSFEFYDKVSETLLVNSVGESIDVFAECSLVRLCNGDKDEYKFLYNDPDGNKIFLSFHDRYIIAAWKSSVDINTIRPTLVWTDGVGKSYMPLPMDMTVQNLRFNEQTKLWQFETEIATAPTPVNSPATLEEFTEELTTDTLKQARLSGDYDQDEISL